MDEILAGASLAVARSVAPLQGEIRLAREDSGGAVSEPLSVQVNGGSQFGKNWLRFVRAVRGDSSITQFSDAIIQATCRQIHNREIRSTRQKVTDFTYHISKSRTLPCIP